jgi:plasmid maintenance system antidote protein VapI
MEPFEITVQDLSNKTKLSVTNIRNIISNREKITDKTGAALDEFYGLHAGFWHTLQLNCDKIARAKEVAENYREKYLVDKQAEEKETKETILKMISSARKEVVLNDLIEAISNIPTNYKHPNLVLLGMMSKELDLRGGRVYLRENTHGT